MALGWPHPDFLLESLTGEQLAGWQDYYSREPWGFPIEDTMSAMQMLVASRVGGSKDSTIEDFKLAQKIADGPDNEDGTPSDEAITRQLKGLFKPPSVYSPPAEEE